MYQNAFIANNKKIILKIYANAKIHLLNLLCDLLLFANKVDTISILSQSARIGQVVIFKLNKFLCL